jgi:shikimate kinase
MGSGKSTIAAQLSRKLKRQLVDTDELIEKRISLSISSIFEKYGEKEFRKLERNIITELSSQKNLIISCGGGLPCYKGNIGVIKNSGIVIWIRVSIEETIRRLSNDRSRPLIQNKNNSQLRKYISHHLNLRKKYYSQADVTIWNRGDVKKVVDKLVTYLHKYPSTLN